MEKFLIRMERVAEAIETMRRHTESISIDPCDLQRLKHQLKSIHALDLGLLYICNEWKLGKDVDSPKIRERLGLIQALLSAFGFLHFC